MVMFMVMVMSAHSARPSFMHSHVYMCFCHGALDVLVIVPGCAVGYGCPACFEVYMCMRVLESVRFHVLVRMLKHINIYMAVCCHCCRLV
jgi:hypothetical protein